MILKGDGRDGEITASEMHGFLEKNLESVPAQDTRSRLRLTRAKSIQSASDEYEVSAMLIEHIPVGRLRTSKLGQLMLGGAWASMSLQIKDLRDPQKSLYFDLTPAKPNGRLQVLTGDPNDVNGGEVRSPVFGDTAAVNYALLGMLQQLVSEAMQATE